jgi:tRNA threonylcarbamoyladenosine biosynthesis protein TsaB
MRVLAIDTATPRCSVALRIDGRTFERSVETQRSHAELVLPMVAEVLQEGGVRLAALDGIGYGRGPGAFTGLRIAVGAVQGLAFGANLPTAGISDLAAVAQQVARPGDEVLVCLDARMGEVYWARFGFDATVDAVLPLSPERVDAPERVGAGSATIFAGNGFGAYPHLCDLSASAIVRGDVLPRASEIALLAEIELRAGRGQPAVQAQPCYLRDRVATPKSM